MKHHEPACPTGADHISPAETVRTESSMIRPGRDLFEPRLNRIGVSGEYGTCLSVSRSRVWGFVARNGGVGRMRCSPERGMGTMLIMAVVVVLLMLSGAIGIAGQYLLAERRAHMAADLAALAGAQSYGSGKGGCVQAKAYASKNNHTLAGCKIAGDAGDFVVTVRVEGPAPVTVPVLPRKITVSAHAGPVRSEEG